MDTVSHFSMGAGIAAVATMNPAVANSEHLPLFFLAVILASNLPDIDVITRVLGAKKFLILHRGPTHSLLVALPAAYFLGQWWASWVPDVNPLFFTAVIMVAVAAHLFTDLTNNYGVALGVPFKSKWYRLSITNTSDTLVLVSHVIALPLFYLLHRNNIDVAWLPLVIVYSMYVSYLLFATVYKILSSYSVKHHYIKDKTFEDVYILSRSNPRSWKYIAVFKKHYKVGYVVGEKVTEIRTVERGETIPSKVEEIVSRDWIWRHFQWFSPIHTIKHNKVNGMPCVYLRDLRYFNKAGKFSFIVNISYDKDGNTKSKLTWTRNTNKRLRKI